METVMFDEKASKNMHLLSKIVYIITKIITIFCYIGLAGLILCLIVVPIVLGHIDTKNSKIKVGDKEYTYELKKNEFTLYENSKKIANEKVNTDIDLEKMISKHPSSYYIGVLESVLGIGALVVVLSILLLRHVSAFFKNISRDDTPFTNDNIVHLKKMAAYLIIMTAVSIVSFSILNIVADLGMSVNINLTDIFYAIILICMAYVFSYGYDLENKKTVNKK